MADTQHTQTPVIDVTIENHGSIFLFEPFTDTARAWIAEHVGDDASFFGTALAVDHRYARDLAAGMVNDGLEVR